MRRGSRVFWFAPALLILLGAKIFLGGVLLRSGGAPSTGVALAQERVKGEIPERLSLPGSKEKDSALLFREEEIRKKEAELIPLKKEIEDQLAELNELQLRLTGYARTLAEREEALKETKMAHLVELYTAMEPAKAAAIMEKLKMETVVMILRHMKGKPAGQIISLMKPETGAQVVEKLSQVH